MISDASSHMKAPISVHDSGIEYAKRGKREKRFLPFGKIWKSAQPEYEEFASTAIGIPFRFL